MPSPLKCGRGRSSIPKYRVKEGRKKGEVYSSFKKIDCEEFIREHQKEYRERLRLIEPNS